MCTKEISLKAAGADGFYYPQEWDPSKGSLDRFQQKRGYEHYFGKHRTRNLDKGILKIRFEMPFHVRCKTCELRIAQGVRFDADKKKVGKYHSTPIYEFTMWCKNLPRKDLTKVYCDQKIVIRTDPKNSGYELVEGITQCETDFDAKDAETMDLPDEDTRRKMRSDPMFKLENVEEKRERAKADRYYIPELRDFQESRWEDSYSANSALRQTFRKRKKEEIAQELEDSKPKNFAIKMVAERDEDREEAKRQRFKTDHSRVERAVKRTLATNKSLLHGKATRGGDLMAKKQRLEMAQKMERKRVSSGSSSGIFGR